MCEFSSFHPLLFQCIVFNDWADWVKSIVNMSSDDELLDDDSLSLVALLC